HRGGNVFLRTGSIYSQTLSDDRAVMNICMDFVSLSARPGNLLSSPVTARSRVPSGLHALQEKNKQ
ncbi:hypothetical protein NL372_27170, partial [Klebsiella pneumoniae]|nr:hypothetical protein [Klebsiella pneumoniae]